MIGSIFALRESELLPRSLCASASLEGSQELEEVQRTSRQEEREARALTCQVCRIGVAPGAEAGFVDVGQQREHFKSDWHRYNVHRSVLNRPSVNREQFEQLLENEDVSSISGSESDPEEEASSRERKDDKRMVCFLLEGGRGFRVWRCLVTEQKALDIEQFDLQEALHQLTDLKSWAVILAKGGHFAAACFEKAAISNPKSKEPLYTVKRHKTFHRYVIRAKSGGRQSVKDATGKHARSMGATLRRHNEAALEREIAEVLSSWRGDLGKCDLIFVSVSSSDSKAVFGGEVPPLNLHDSRVRRIPFPTRRPTFSEVKRVSHLLTATYKAPESPQESQSEQGVQPGTQLASHREEQSIPEALVHEATLSDAPPVVEPAPKSSKKKSRRKPKGKDQRRQAAMDVAGESEEVVDNTKEPDDEVERAIAAAARHVEGLQRLKKAQTQKKKQTSKVDASQSENPVERREVLRKAAERRLASLQTASKNQQLW